MSNQNQTPPNDNPPDPPDPQDPSGATYQPPGDDGDDEGGGALARIDQSGLASIAKSEAMAQVDVAHAYPRDLGKFLETAVKVATMNQATAQSCMYTLKRKAWDPVAKKRVEKRIVGPSIRLAEIAAHAFKNIHSGARPIAVGETTVTCQGIAWDLENNVRVTREVTRRIVGKGDDMLVLAINATCAIAQRNAILSVVPRAYINEIFDRVRHTASGGKKPIEQKRQDLLLALAKYGVDQARVLASLDIKSVSEITIEHVEELIGLGTRLKEGESIDALFPVPEKNDPGPMPGTEQEGQRVDVGKKPEPAAATVAPTTVTATTSGTASATPAEVKLSEAAGKKGGGAQISFASAKPEPTGAEPSDEEADRLGAPKRDPKP